VGRGGEPAAVDCQLRVNGGFGLVVWGSWKLGISEKKDIQF